MAVARFNWHGTINWFPGHMAKASRMLKETVKGSDLVMEVRYIWSYCFFST
jgi:ribosome biogenesis GTPase A